MNKVIEMKREVKGNKYFKKAKLAGKIFVDGAKKTDPTSVIVVSSVNGLRGGLKYGGSLKRGVNSAVGSAIVLVVIDGLRNVANNWELVKRG